MGYGVRIIGIGGWLRYWRERLRKPAEEHELPDSNISEREEDAAIERERHRREEDAASSTST
jgi:hypothetical protein